MNYEQFRKGRQRYHLVCVWAYAVFALVGVVSPFLFGSTLGGALLVVALSLPLCLFHYRELDPG